MAALNYHHLRYFRAIAREGSLTGAARRLNVAPSALSIQLRTLEDALGHALFARTGRTLTLTEAGRIALDHAETIFRTGEDLVARLKGQAAAQQVLRIGAVATLSRNFQLGLLGPLIGEVAGGDHRSYVRETILLPLGMTSTAWTPEDVPGDRLAVGHERMPGQPPRARPHWRPGAADAAGGLYSSIEDLARYAAFNLAAWPARDEPEAGPLRRSTLREAQSLSVLTSYAAASMRDGPARLSISGAGLGFVTSRRSIFPSRLSGFWARFSGSPPEPPSPIPTQSLRSGPKTMLPPLWFA